jgi:hypothetical protein
MVTKTPTHTKSILVSVSDELSIVFYCNLRRRVIYNFNLRCFFPTLALNQTTCGEFTCILEAKVLGYVFIFLIDA